MRSFCFLAALLIATSGVVNGFAQEVDFERDVAPVLVNACLDCHRPGKANGGLDVTTAASFLKGGDSGAAIEPGKPAESLLLSRLFNGEMPPEDEEGKPPRRRPTEQETQNIKNWIAAGASWPKDRELGLHEQTVDLEKAKTFWSFQPVRRPKLPSVGNVNTVVNAIDAFIRQKLDAAHLQLAPPAGRATLLRRAHLDVLGLPPNIEVHDAFLADPSPQAYERMIDGLLANPGYGERWARHWLDVVRYADSNGYERDGDKPNVWKYRDYVIDSLNADKPYDRFVMEQIAGDELPDASNETIIAMGFHALGTWNDEVDPLEAAQYRADEVDDLVRTTSQTFLGLTVGCARCHNHKFDPLTMVDYYSLAAIVDPLKRPNEGRVDRDRPVGTPEQHAAIAARDQKIGAIIGKVHAIRMVTEKELLASGKSKLPDDAVAAYQASTEKRTPQQHQLVLQHMKAFGETVDAALPAKAKEEIASHFREIEGLKQQTPDLPRAYYLFEESPKSPVTHLLLSGRASNPGPVMQPRVPAVLTSQQPLFAPNERTSRRRIALAQWMVSDDNPLTARVMVNRVWQHHFGKGLVATPSDFGDRGARPTHPELLDYLAHWFVHDANWSLKKLHRLILTSELYQASSTASAEATAKDPENQLLSHYPLTRLDVEAIRDSMLTVSGELNGRMHGPAVYLPIAKEVIDAHTDKQEAWKKSPPSEIRRRSVYGYVKRTLLVPMMEVLDLCDVSSSSDRRITTSIAPQALALYNGEFVNQQATALAKRLAHETGDRDRQVERLYRLALCRQPTADEAMSLRKFLETESAGQLRESPAITQAEAERRALVQLCRVVLNLNEFVYPQ
jgi:hypothetical protein